MSATFCCSNVCRAQTSPIKIGSLDLAALLCSRVCHDLISPVGAIVNGLEVMEDDNDQETKAFAMDLIKKSVRQASAKLQFCRLAFGAAGSAGAQIDIGDAEKVARGFLEDDKTKIAWNLPRLLLPKNRVKLLLNMILIAGQSIRAAARLRSIRSAKARPCAFRISATGGYAKVPQAVPDLLAGGTHGGTSMRMRCSRITPALLAKDCGLTVARQRTKAT